MTVLFKNNAYSILAAGAAPSATAFTVSTGDGDLFPSPTGSEWFPLTLVKQSGEIEICKCTARSGDTLTVTRAQEGTAALTWAVNERIELRLTAAALAGFLRTYGGDLRVTASGGELSFSVDGGSVGTMATKEDESTFKTGMRIGYVGTAAPTGWVMASGRTIGSADSGGTERANADTADLYALLWSSYTNSELIIQDSSGTPTTRGASAAADFAANKRMPLPDYRGRVAAGKDDMGGTSANRLTTAGGGIDGDVLGKTGGTETHTLTSAQMPSHTHTGTTASSTHSHTVNGGSTAGAGSNACSSAGTDQTITTASSNGAHTHTFTTDSTGTGDAHQNMQPTIIENVIIKL